MIDFVDEEIQEYEELTPEERYLTLMLADLAAAVILVAVSLLL